MIVALLFIFILLQIADSLTTVHILKNGREANPLLRWLFNKIGVVAGLAIMKTAAIIAMVALYNEYVTAALNVWYFGVVGWNSYQILKTK